MNRRALRELYHSTPVPEEELSRRVEEAIRRQRPRPRMRGWQKSLTGLAACFALFVVSVNLSPAFAASLQDVPLVGDVAQLVTFDHFHQVDAAKDIVVEIPAIRGTGNTALEQQVNSRIADKMEALQLEAAQMAEEYLEAYNATKAPEDPEFWKVKILIDYELKNSTPELLSFVLRSSRTAANAYSQEFYYNINMQTGADVTLEDLLGPDWRELCNQAVTQGIAQRLAQDPNAIYYTTEDDDPSDDEFAFRTVTEDQSFYINERGNPVVVFAKYQIAPGYMGIQEFEVPRP